MSENGAYILSLQEADGNLCIYKYANGKQGSFVWGSMKSGFKNAKLTMQTDGNLVVYNDKNESQWASNTHPFNDAKYNDSNNKPVKLVLENDGVLKLYNAQNAVMWSSIYPQHVPQRSAWLHQIRPSSKICPPPNSTKYAKNASWIQPHGAFF